MKPAASFLVSIAAAAGTFYAACLPAATQTPPGPAPAVVPTPASALAAAPADAASAPPSASRGATSVRLPFATLGAFDPLRLRGADDARTIHAGVRLDRVVTGARLRLTYAYSPSLVFPMSHLKVSVNGEVVATVPFDAPRAGKMVTQDIPIDPRYFSDFNQIGLRLIAHYTLDHCEDPMNSALWADVSPTSELILDESPVRLPNDLALLPAPFFDRRDNGLLRLPFVLPASPDTATLRSAGVLASWFGALADYRHARFPVSSALPASDNAVLIGPVTALPPGLALPSVTGPTLAVADNPAAPERKVLVVTGRSAAEVDDAVAALVLGRAALSGPSATVARVDLGAPRKPYDAPRWLPVDRPIAFRELVGDPRELEVRGTSPDAIRLNLRVPADLHSWNGSGVPITLRYRYTAPTVQDNSTLAVEINDQLVKSYRLGPSHAEDARGRMQLPLLSVPEGRVTSDVDIPAFRVGSGNQLQFRFTLDSQKTGLCSSTATEPQRAAIDPDSTIDFSHFVHYAQLPNLAYFANSGFPFTRFADLSQTAVVVAGRPSPQELEAYLTMLGHMGQWTGFPALRVQVVRPGEVAALAGNKDLLVIDGAPSLPLLGHWRDALPLSFGEEGGAGGTRVAFTVKERWRNGVGMAEGSARIEQTGSLAALLGFELPGSRGRSVVALSATDPARLGSVLDVFENAGLVSQLQGDLALVRPGSVDGMRVGDPYVVGFVPWYARLWTVAARHPVVLGAVGVVAGLLLALGAFSVLQRIAARRRGM
ncbi:cellulose biosynthesis cyclic di-GMP-binding regulatory protein BcsB [Burkholderia stagnalis]|uniref:cellulose biosynthesis cyclic di-GMP-binding regulatory protein BcsB n=1 Tax=Burkholderia stagnalis TaxID=1503054 RepID=UPI000F58CC6B|nr:cellulose biosynthesis cyclic di-GMP-binding regulatory protein BcsB [Burkholderia stagnalis]RQQ03271.1 cellulose biosynthesis cyclic di-GMP-binding regulatory protein BcsB [Burkholderia stagnalis]RQQ19776.1 cellulose biosynthesis cyclic di-GMP-binding regulatory protein BcsB [Burkholderia stagnalis]RQQ28121.1 cellulose biosynthesis cyclic di-GMP-binding regulatory protein BcsB [Burkholderia stagnalis]RQQ32969.1 cellulose biosynthesis cyclic di-GMP-binding regulatory protein BcsB [Burkholder